MTLYVLNLACRTSLGGDVRCARTTIVHQTQLAPSALQAFRHRRRSLQESVTSPMVLLMLEESFGSQA